MRYLIATLALVSIPAAAVAAPVKLVPAPDGAIDLREGDAPIAHVALKTPPLRRGTPVLREETVDGHRLVELRIPIRGTAAAEVWIGDVAGRGKPPLWSGITGPRDADAETGAGIELTAEHLLEYQTAAGVTRCDGVEPRLFPRVYDFDSGRFRPVLSALPPAGIETLVARRGDPAMPPGRPLGGFHWMAASSTRAAGSDARALGAPVELNDADVGTAWSEGLGGDGRGEFLTARATATGYAIRGLRIFPGDGSSLEALRRKNRVRRFQVAFGPAREQRFDVEIPADPAADAARWKDAYWVPLPKPIVSSCVTVVVTDVTPGKDAAPPKSFGTTAIGELSVFTDLDTPEGAERLVADLGERARLRHAAAAGRGPGEGGGASSGAGRAVDQGAPARVPGRSADDAGADAREPGRAGGADRGGGGREREGGAAGDRGAGAREDRAGVGAGAAAGGRERAGRGPRARGARARGAGRSGRGRGAAGRHGQGSAAAARGGGRRAGPGARCTGRGVAGGGGRRAARRRPARGRPGARAARADHAYARNGGPTRCRCCARRRWRPSAASRCARGR